MTTDIEIAQVEVRDNAYWPEEALLADFVEKDDQVAQTDQSIEGTAEYTVLYFVS